MSPKQVKITPGTCATAIAVVDATHRDHADRAAGPVDELDVRGQEVVDAVLVDRVRVPAAHLHDLVLPAGLDGREDLAREHPPELRVPILVDELHATLASATPACTRRLSPAATGPTRSTITSLSTPLRLAPGEPVVQRRDDAHRHSLVGARDAVRVGRAAHSITLAFSSSSSCS